MQQRTNEWYEARKGRVTASSAGAILGCDPYRGPEDVMRQMVREWHGAEPEFTGNPATEYGTANEDRALFDFQCETLHDVDKCGFFTHEDWLGASPDGLIGEKGLVEIKCPYGKRNDENPAFKSINDLPHYYAQCQIQMLATGRKWVQFYQWAPNGARLEAVKPDALWINENLIELSNFYARYLDERENNAAEHLEAKRVIVDTPDAHKMLEEWDDLREQEERIKERKADLLKDITALADGKNGKIAGRNVTLVEREGSISYSKAIKELLPDADLEPYRGKASSHWRIG